MINQINLQLKIHWKHIRKPNIFGIDGTSTQISNMKKDLKFWNICAVNELNSGTCTHLMTNDDTNVIELTKQVDQ